MDDKEKAMVLEDIDSEKTNELLTFKKHSQSALETINDQIDKTLTVFDVDRQITVHIKLEKVRIAIFYKRNVAKIFFIKQG